ncbi:MAG: hypothetical protein ACRERD_07710 [Candidatus Binatia bacterium]
MRTTLTLDDDVVVLLQRMQEKRKGNLKEIVNEALRAGFAQMTTPRKRSTLYRTPAVSLGRCLVGSLDDVAEVLAVSEGEPFR